MMFKKRSKKEKIDIEKEIQNALKKSEKRPMVYLGDYKALTQTIFGHTIFVDTRDISLSPHILSKGFWEIWITQTIMELIKPGMNIVEIGANIGYYTILAASKLGSKDKVYAFEADDNNFEILYRNIEINGFLEKTILVNKAVFSESKKINFYSLNNHHGSNSAAPFSKDFLNKYRDEMTTSKVDSVSLDDYFNNNMPKIDLLKIDAEGCEPHIFKGMKNFLNKNYDIKIICEFAPSLISALNENPEKFLDDLLKQGFCLAIIDPYEGIQKISKEKVLKIPYSELFLYKNG